MEGIYWIAEELSASRQGFWSIYLFIYLFILAISWHRFLLLRSFHVSLATTPQLDLPVPFPGSSTSSNVACFLISRSFHVSQATTPQHDLPVPFPVLVVVVPGKEHRAHSKYWSQVDCRVVVVPGRKHTGHSKCWSQVDCRVVVVPGKGHRQNSKYWTQVDCSVVVVPARKHSGHNKYWTQ
jgi:hypothetical protein